MTIKEQIEIARSIASGTPREVAINEVAITSSMEKSSPPYEMKKGKDYEVVSDKKSPHQLNKERDAKRREITKQKNQNKSKNE
mgnify:FL=1